MWWVISLTLSAFAAVLRQARMLTHVAMARLSVKQHPSSAYYGISNLGCLTALPSGWAAGVALRVAEAP